MVDQHKAGIDTVRASRDGHTFHERWAARRSLELVFPQDGLFAIALEGLSSNETADPGQEAEDVADLILYYGKGDTFETCTSLQTLQFKYKASSEAVTSYYLKKTLQKFASTILGYEKTFSEAEVNQKLSFSFVTNAEFSDHLWDAIKSLASGVKTEEKKAKEQFDSLEKWCRECKVDARRLFSLVSFRASTKNLGAQNRLLSKTLSNWSAGVDSHSRVRLHGLIELVREKAGLSGQGNNLIKHEDVLDVLGCDPEDLFPAETRFIDVGSVVERSVLKSVVSLVKDTSVPVFLFADGGVGKTVFIQSLSTHLANQFETVVFDCFGGGAYRSDDQARHLPKIGLVQIANELASRGLCDPLLQTESDRYGLVKAMRKRLEQAGKVIRRQSDKEGVLIILDAADNAQLEANNRNEDAFPQLLLSTLSETPIDGVKLLLTARPHRMDGVIGKSVVERFELIAFSKGEAGAFLQSRKGEISSIEFKKAFARSNGNARVLEYLVESWEENVAESSPNTKIFVEEIIGQKCNKIISELHVVGWNDFEVKAFFTAIALLPPPIPLSELAKALGWPESQVNSAASDLAPMLEIVIHGAIFRDEPTETYIRDTYSKESIAQQAIAQRLEDSQSKSIYAAEALPRFLVLINDSARAFALANSAEFPKSIQSEYGRRRLKLARLYAAFSLSVKEGDIDRTLKLTMLLAQLASANAKGDHFIRRSPALATVLGGQDASRRLFKDRSGWRGERNSRLTIAYAFQNEMEEAEIHQNRAIGWINWCIDNKEEDDFQAESNSQPDESDFAAVVFLHTLQGNYELVNKNVNGWDFNFALRVCNGVITLSDQYEAYTGNRVLDSLASFASTKKCTSFALQVSILSKADRFVLADSKKIARSASSLARTMKVETNTYHDREQTVHTAISRAALSALIFNSQLSSARILSATTSKRPSSYEYGQQGRLSHIWNPILYSCVNAWSRKRRISYLDLLPHEIAITHKVRAVDSQKGLLNFLEKLKISKPVKHARNKSTAKLERQFNTSECENIVDGIELIFRLINPLEAVILSEKVITDNHLSDFLDIWSKELRATTPLFQNEYARDGVCRNTGIGIAGLLLQYANEISPNSALQLLELVRKHFTIDEGLRMLGLISRRENLHELVGEFAQKFSEDICKDEYIENRSEHYLDLAAALLGMSVSEAKEYYKQGLSQLDQMGAGDYDLIYSVLRYSAEQSGGFLEKKLGHRLMNLCQTIFQDEPIKFGWTLFSRAAAKSIGYQSVHKLIRWGDQEVADYSYGLPQLACFLANNKELDSRRATVLLMLCEDHSWHAWQVGEGLDDLLAGAELNQHKAIISVLLGKLKAEHSFGGWGSSWKSVLNAVEKYPDAINQADVDDLKRLIVDSDKRQNEDNTRGNGGSLSSSPSSFDKASDEEEIEIALVIVAKSCDINSASSIDESLQKIKKDHPYEYGAGFRFLDQLRKICPYDKRSDLTFSLCEVTELTFEDTIEQVIKNVELWRSSSSYIGNSAKEFTKRIFSFKGSELFQLSYSSITRPIHQLIDFSDDSEFVIRLVLETIVKEQLELSGEEWVDLATCLCLHSRPETQLIALEELLSGPAAIIGDDIGEGSYQQGFDVTKNQSNLISEVIWHLLGDTDAFVRWDASRSIKALVDLGLFEDLTALFDCFDCDGTPSLQSENQKLSFQNSRQWFLMGLSRATLHHKEKLGFLQSRLERLSERHDVHVIHKLHILRCLTNICGEDDSNDRLQRLKDEVNYPPHGYKEKNHRAIHKESQVDFSFDYEFRKYEVSNLAGLFGITKNEASDFIAAEILRVWPEAESMSYFLGDVSYRRMGSEHNESYPDHIQKHAFYSAATTLLKTYSVALNYHDLAESSPWMEWLYEHDVSFGDGSWLSDHKDTVPKEAHEYFLKKRAGGNQEALDIQDNLLRKIGVSSGEIDQLVPIDGHWKSKDGVHVRINTALIDLRGAIKNCTALSKEPDHNLWVPTFASDGYEERHMAETLFEPLIWNPGSYPIGIDKGDQLATTGAISRPRLGNDLTKELEIFQNETSDEWLFQNGSVALKSQVWGRWEPDPDQYQYRTQNEGVLLWALPKWLDRFLLDNKKALVYHINFQKYKSRRRYDDDSGLKAVYVGLRKSDGSLRFWKAKNASKN